MVGSARSGLCAERWNSEMTCTWLPMQVPFTQLLGPVMQSSSVVQTAKQWGGRHEYAWRGWLITVINPSTSSPASGRYHVEEAVGRVVRMEGQACHAGLRDRGVHALRYIQKYADKVKVRLVVYLNDAGLSSIRYRYKKRSSEYPISAISTSSSIARLASEEDVVRAVVGIDQCDPHLVPGVTVADAEVLDADVVEDGELAARWRRNEFPSADHHIS